MGQSSGVTQSVTIVWWIIDMIKGLKIMFEIITDNILEEISEDSKFRCKTECQGCKQSSELRI